MTEFYPINGEFVYDEKNRRLTLGRYIAITPEGMSIGDGKEIQNAAPISEESVRLKIYTPLGQAYYSRENGTLEFPAGYVKEEWAVNGSNVTSQTSTGCGAVLRGKFLFLNGQYYDTTDQTLVRGPTGYTHAALSEPDFMDNFYGQKIKKNEFTPFYYEIINNFTKNIIKEKKYKLNEISDNTV